MKQWNYRTLRIKTHTAYAMALLALATGSLFAGNAPPQTQPAYTNQLAGEKSPYLLQHAHNPVDWYPWGDEAFAKAARENKPIFLSIGYSTCHWCHVMERESFEDPQVAKLINEHFVAIKVDREERPDVDAVYMQFVIALTGDGGWPLTVFLTPDRKPFFGGTYFPPEDRDGIPGLTRVLNGVASAWAAKHDQVVASANQLSQKLKDSAAVVHQGRLRPKLLDQAFDGFREQFDVHLGGFGNAPKFPRPVAINFLFHYYRRTGDKTALDMGLKTLRAMAAGGICDQLGGGFHRYSTDERWFLPHFEKMLYDQAQLAQSYLDAYQLTHDPQFADVARGILDFVLRDMTGSEGQFYCAQDADSAIAPGPDAKKAEGAYYVWTADEIQAALGASDAATFNYRFGVVPAGNVTSDLRGELQGKNVLYQAHTIEETAAQFQMHPERIVATLNQAKQTLLRIRDARPRPARDDKALAGWNGLMISAMARGGAVLSEPRYTAAAVRCAQFLQTHLLDSTTHRLHRSWLNGADATDGFLDDYAFNIQGFIDLYEGTFDIHWLQLAIDLQKKQDELLLDAQSGCYFQSGQSDVNVPFRLKDEEDNAQPAGNSIAALNLLRLGQMTDDQKRTEQARKVLEANAAQIERSPTQLPQMLVAYDFDQSSPVQIVLVARADAPDTLLMLQEINRRYIPDHVLLLDDAGESGKFFAAHVQAIKAMSMLDGKATAYVCRHYACERPVNDPQKLAAALDQIPAPALKMEGQ